MFLATDSLNLFLNTSLCILKVHWPVATTQVSSLESNGLRGSLRAYLWLIMPDCINIVCIKSMRVTFSTGISFTKLTFHVKISRSCVSLFA